MKKFQNVSVVMAIPAILNIVIGIAIVAIRDGGEQPVNSGIQIISSAMVGIK